MEFELFTVEPLLRARAPRGTGPFQGLGCGARHARKVQAASNTLHDLISRSANLFSPRCIVKSMAASVHLHVILSSLSHTNRRTQLIDVKSTLTPDSTAADRCNRPLSVTHEKGNK